MEVAVPLAAADVGRTVFFALRDGRPRFFQDLPLTGQVLELPYERTIERTNKLLGILTVKSAGVYWGQMKLLLSEIEFLSWCQRRLGRDCLKRHIVVYAGAADGRHTPQLLKLFPDLQIELWDPSPFSEEVQKAAGPRLRYTNAFFTDEVAANYRKSAKPILFISDIRRMPGHQLAGRDEKIRGLKDEDHEWQRRWVEIIKPAATMLKFAPPYGEGKKSYFAGAIRTQAFPPRSTTEMRLIFEGVPECIEYDCGRFERVCAYITHVDRIHKLSMAEFLSWSAPDGPIVSITDVPATKVPWVMLDNSPRYDDWRALQIMIMYLLTTAAPVDSERGGVQRSGIDSERGGAFDDLGYKPTQSAVRAAIMDGLKLLAGEAKLLGGTVVVAAARMLQKNSPSPRGVAPLYNFFSHTWSAAKC